MPQKRIYAVLYDVERHLRRFDGRPLASFASVRIAVLALVGAVVSCIEEPAPECQGPEPTFVLNIRSEQANLPTDLVIRIKYGADDEEYQFGVTPKRKALFCQPVALDGSNISVDAGESRVPALRCELWTDGAAILEITTDEYADIEKQLEARADQCGIRTVEVDLTLIPDDAGGP